MCVCVHPGSHCSSTACGINTCQRQLDPDWFSKAVFDCADFCPLSPANEYSERKNGSCSGFCVLPRSVKVSRSNCVHLLTCDLDLQHCSRLKRLSLRWKTWSFCPCGLGTPWDLWVEYHTKGDFSVTLVLFCFSGGKWNSYSCANHALLPFGIQLNSSVLTPFKKGLIKKDCVEFKHRLWINAPNVKHLIPSKVSITNVKLYH